MKTRGGAGPSGLDGDGWRRILCSKNFKTESNDLCLSLARMAKHLCTTIETDNSLEAFLSSRLIPLNKNPGLRPIGIGETLRRIIGKTVARLLKQDIADSVGSLQVCAGQDAGCEAAIHALREIFRQDDTEAVMLVDASNAFNAVNRNAFLHNVNVICPSIATFTTNCYSSPSRLFVIGGIEIASSEGTTQGDPIAGLVYAIATIPLIMYTVGELREHNTNTKAAGYADDVFGGGTIRGLKRLWDTIVKWGPKYGYFQQASKTWVIVKPQYLEEATEIFKDTNIKITTEGKKHLGAAIGSENFCEEFITDKVNTWISEIETLTEIAKIAPHEAYTCFTSGYKHKLNFTLRTIPNIKQHLQRLDEIITARFIPAITGGIQPNETERELFTLPPSLGGLGIPKFSDISDQEFSNSEALTKQLQNKIKSQDYVNDIDKDEITKLKSSFKRYRMQSYRQKLELIKQQSPIEMKKLIEINSEPGASLWLSTLPIKEEGFQFDKTSFWDLIKIRYGHQLSRLPTICPCGSPFDLGHALSCKKGGFIIQRHNSIRDTTASLLTQVCKDVKVEPILTTLSGETFETKSTNIQDHARLDIAARGFWIPGQKAFFDVRVFNPIAKKFRNSTVSKACDANEREKKNVYNSRIMKVEHGSFTPIVFTAMGGMGRETRHFYKRLSELLSEKRNESLAITTTWDNNRLCPEHLTSLELYNHKVRSSDKQLLDEIPRYTNDILFGYKFAVKNQFLNSIFQDIWKGLTFNNIYQILEE
ncbi:uncharacterized protein [Clytia hemisphaerica]|uniref:uncharacterized protein n=1 Tax=Clytia hemisphaerica TaxID=252671 RepID=UPI0034D4787C